MGLPVVGFREAPAVNELLQEGYNGLLTGTGVDSYSQGLARLMRNQALRVQMGKNAQISIQPYHADTIWQQWQELLERVRIQ